MNALLNLGSEFKSAREAKGLTQQEVADRAGVHRVTVANLERSHEEPGVMTAIRIAAVLGVSLDKLVHAHEDNDAKKV